MGCPRRTKVGWRRRWVRFLGEEGRGRGFRRGECRGLGRPWLTRVGAGSSGAGRRRAAPNADAETGRRGPRPESRVWTGAGVRGGRGSRTSPAARPAARGGPPGPSPKTSARGWLGRVPAAPLSGGSPRRPGHHKGREGPPAPRPPSSPRAPPPSGPPLPAGETWVSAPCGSRVEGMPRAGLWGVPVTTPAPRL